LSCIDAIVPVEQDDVEVIDTDEAIAGGIAL